MATKIPNLQLMYLIFSDEIKEKYIYDTYAALVTASSEVNEKFIIQTDYSSVANLVNIVKRYINSPSQKTIDNCIRKLMKINFIKYVDEIKSWVLVDMEYMLGKKSTDEIKEKAKIYMKEDPALAEFYEKSFEFEKNFKGFTHMRSFFLDKEFSSLKAREKRILLYFASLSDKEEISKNYSGAEFNFNRYESTWYKVIRTKDKYYARRTVEKFINKYNGTLITDISEEFRDKDLSFDKDRNSKFRFAFSCLKIENKITKSAEEKFEVLKEKYSSDYNLICARITNAKLKLDEITKLNILKSLSTLRNAKLKDEALRRILNRYKKIKANEADKIMSIKAYLTGIIFNITNHKNYDYNLDSETKKSEYESTNSKLFKDLVASYC